MQIANQDPVPLLTPQADPPSPDETDQLARTSESHFILACAGFCPLAQIPEPLPRKDPQILGRALTDWFYRGEVQRLWEMFSPALRDYFGTIDRFSDYRRKFLEKVGEERQLVSESVRPKGGNLTYSREIIGSLTDRHFTLSVTLEPSGAVDDFWAGPTPQLAPSRFLDYRTQTRLKLPFEYNWFVFWGGRTLEENRKHGTVRDQRFAYDFTVMRRGSTHAGDGRRNEDYYCFGKPILAPGRGVVVRVENGLPDNLPGQKDREHVAGNHVVIDHRNGEYSILAHLRQGSVRVRVGDFIGRGDPIGRCGNSGNTSEPHLHYHLQNQPDLHKGEGLPAQFIDFEVDGLFLRRGEPVRGQTIRRVK